MFPANSRSVQAIGDFPGEEISTLKSAVTSFALDMEIDPTGLFRPTRFREAGLLFGR